MGGVLFPRHMLIRVESIPDKIYNILIIITILLMKGVGMPNAKENTI